MTRTTTGPANRLPSDKPSPCCSKYGDVTAGVGAHRVDRRLAAVGVGDEDQVLGHDGCGDRNITATAQLKPGMLYVFVAAKSVIVRFATSSERVAMGV